MRCFFILCVLYLSSLQATQAETQQVASSSETNLIQSAVDRARSKSVTKLEILYFPKEMETRVGVTPQLLEEWCFFRISIKDLQYSNVTMKNGLVSALEESAAKKANGNADLRWGCIFYDTSGTRVLALYFNGSGTEGYVDSTPISSNGKLVRFLEKRCASLWK